MDIEMFGKLSDAFGPSGFEEDVIRTIADYCKEFDVENDAMNNLYVRMPGTKQDSVRSSSLMPIWTHAVSWYRISRTTDALALSCLVAFI